MEKLSPPERLLAKTLKEKKLMKPKEKIPAALLRWMPKVKLKKWSKYEIDNKIDDWQFLNQIHVNDSLSFRCEILAQQKSLETGKERIRVKWIPNGIIDNSWIDKSAVPFKGIKKFKVQTMNWKQKLLIRDKLFTKL